jgi:hypothetical protein
MAGDVASDGAHWAALYRRTLLLQHILVDAGRLAGDVLENDGVYRGRRPQAQWPSGGSQPSCTGGCQSAPTVREPSTHGPSSGCGNLACFSLSWIP